MSTEITRRIGNNFLSVVGERWFDDFSHYNDRIPEFLHPEIVKLAESGISGRQIAKLTGYHRLQVARLLRKFPKADSALCACGLPRKHQGWCRIRYAASEARQEFIKLWTLRAKLKRLKDRGLSFAEACELVKAGHNV